MANMFHWWDTDWCLLNGEAITIFLLLKVACIIRPNKFLGVEDWEPPNVGGILSIICHT